MSIYEVLGIIIIHWFADFLMQDEKWALGKSKNNDDLFKHVLMYTFIWWVAIVILLSPNLYKPLYLFAPITFVCHWITDYFTSRIVSKKFANNQYGSPIPNWGAFTIIGIDQVLHYIQLFVTYYLLK